MTKKDFVKKLASLYPEAESVSENKDGLFDVLVIDLNKEVIYTYSLEKGRGRFIGVSECEI